jgi:hypothetical protein
VIAVVIAVGDSGGVVVWSAVAGDVVPDTSVVVATVSVVVSIVVSAVVSVVVS